MKSSFTDILILFGSNSQLEWGRSFQLAQAFHQNGCRIVYIDLPVRIFSKKQIGYVQKSENFHIIKPAYGLPIGKLPFLYPLNHTILFYQVKSALNTLGFSPQVLWSYTPYQSSVLKSLKGFFKPEMTVYDCSDERIAMARKAYGEKGADQVAYEEGQIMKHSDIVFTVSKPLQKLKGKIHPHVYHLPNGVNRSHFNTWSEWDCPKEYSGLTGRKILYTGSLEFWLDLIAIAEAAKSFTGDHFFLVGPELTDIGMLKDFKNIHILGSLPHHVMAQYISHADICINPIKPTSVTNYSDSMKTLQYLAMGKPVLSIDYGHAKDYDGFVILANSTSDFVEKLGSIQSEPVYLHRKNDWSQLLDDYSWTSIAEKAMHHMLSRR